MVEKKSKDKEMKTNISLLENQRFIKKYGLFKDELEKKIQDDLKFDEFFLVAADYLIRAKALFSSNRDKEAN